MGATVVAAGERAEALLTCCVPHGELAFLVVERQILDAEVDAFRKAREWMGEGGKSSVGDITRQGFGTGSLNALFAPIVDVVRSSNLSCVKRIKMQLLPTPLSPTSRICNRNRSSVSCNFTGVLPHPQLRAEPCLKQQVIRCGHGV